MITTAHRMESLSRAYLQAVAAKAGLNYCLFGFDYGTDICLREVEDVGGRYIESGLQVDVQLKSTTRAIVTDREIKYDLDVRTYDQLRRTDNILRLFVLLVLPEDEAEWVEQSEEELMLRRCAYWLVLRGGPDVQSVSTVRVSIPRENLLTANALLEIISRKITTKEEP